MPVVRSTACGVVYMTGPAMSHASFFRAAWLANIHRSLTMNSPKTFNDSLTENHEHVEM